LTEIKVINLDLHLIFDILQFEIWNLMNWIFAGYTCRKNPVQTRKKIQLIKLENFKNQVQIDMGDGIFGLGL
jgi:hypothetical protein